MPLAAAAMLLMLGCQRGEGMTQRVSVLYPTRGDAVRVVVDNASEVGAGSAQPMRWSHDCEVVRRLGEDESRRAWIQRIENVIEGSPNRLVSVSYPLGPDGGVALVCFARPLR